MEIEFGVLKRDELKDAVELSVRAYENYEYFVNFFPDKEERLKALKGILYRAWLTSFKTTHFLAAKIQGKMVATAQLDDPHYKKPSVLQFLLHGWLLVYIGVNVKRMNSWIAMDEGASRPCHDFQKSAPDIWYISSLTVEPSEQGKGVGTELIAFMEQYARERGGKQISLFTNSERNLAFYKSCGFQIFHECEIVHDGKQMGSWSLKKAL